MVLLVLHLKVVVVNLVLNSFVLSKSMAVVLKNLLLMVLIVHVMLLDSALVFA